MRQKSRPKPKRCGENEVCDYQLIGELKGDGHKLLLMGADGQYYAYDLVGGDIVALDPDDSWSVDISLTTSPRTSASPEKVAS
jgi:hypothetical protein